MRLLRIVLQRLVTVLLAVALTMAFAPAAVAQTLAEAFAYTEAQKIVEVRVYARSKPGGRGWALTGEESGIKYCYIVTPFHVIGDEVTRTVHNDIVVEGAGYRLKPRAQHIADDGRDLALLLLDREGRCPFTDGPSAGRAATGLWLVRLADTKVREEIAGDTRVPIAPASENLDIASLTILGADRTAFKQGWSGATIFRDGRRIGMVVEAANEGATARFYTAQGIVRAFGDQIAIYKRDEGGSAVTEVVAATTAPPVGKIFKDCADCPEMVVVPAGRFTMGSPDSEPKRASNEGPIHEVNVRPFAVGKYEVTFDQWDACVAGGGCNGHRPDDRRWGRGRRPVINVSWHDAKAYVRWLSGKTRQEYRLLSEAEWEYVARAGTITPFSTGSTISPDRANYLEKIVDWFGGKTVPVGSFSSNAFGLYDVHGNVWEWVEDCWHDSYSGAPGDGGAWTSDGDCSKRVMRGGSWINKPRNLRSAARFEYGSDNRDKYNGFRVARTL